MNNLISTINNKTKIPQAFLQDENIKSLLFVVAVGFGSQFFPTLPTILTKNPLAQSVLVGLLVNWSSKNMAQGLIAAFIALIFFLIIQQFEGFEILENTTNIIPGCEGITKDDLVELFEGDEDKLIDTILRSGVPQNLILNDIDAPLIATYLAAGGYIVGDDCQLPTKQVEMKMKM